MRSISVWGRPWPHIISLAVHLHYSSPYLTWPHPAWTHLSSPYLACPHKRKQISSQIKILLDIKSSKCCWKIFIDVSSWQRKIIERECEKGSVNHSDEWPAYNNLNAIGYHHLIVNHQQHYMDPVTGAHTQAIQRLWLHAKTMILKKKKMRGVGSELFQSHLDHFCLKMMRKDSDDLFVSFLNDLISVYCWNASLKYVSCRFQRVYFYLPAIYI